MYTDIPDCFQPTAIVGSTYYFDEGPYNSEISRYVYDQETITTQQPSVSSVIVSAATDDSSPVVPLSGVRRVRNIAISGELHFRFSSSRTPDFVQWTVDLLVVRNKLPVSVTDNILASYPGCSCVSANASLANVYAAEGEKFKISYPGFVDLHRGDSIVFRMSARKSVGSEYIYFTGNFNTQCCVRNV